MVNHTKPSPFSGFRLRHALTLLVCLGVILMLAGYFAVSASQRASLEAVMVQGRALTETLISSAQIAIESDEAITALAISRLIEGVSNLDLKAQSANEGKLEEWRQVLGVDRICAISKRDITHATASRESALELGNVQAWLDSLEIDPDADIIYDFRTIGRDRFLFSYFPNSDSSGIFVSLKWEYGQYGNERLSLYYLLNQVGQESGIEYIMLQNENGIVFASKKIASMPKLSDDPFLAQAMITDTTRSRLIMFQDREVLESVKIFKSRDFEGVFRVGLSLYGYRQIEGSVKRQIWLVVAALVIVGMLAFGIIVGFQNYEFLKAGLEKARVVAQSLLDSIPGPVVAIDSRMKITDINAMARNRLGISHAQGAGNEYSQVFPEDPFHFKQVVEGGRSASFEKVMGGDRRQYYITTTPLIGSGGAVIGAIAVAQDITDARKLEGVAESRRRLSELGALAASMAHEIRNPLNAIGITIQRMKSEIRPAGSEDEYQKFLDGLRGEMQRLNEIIEKFLAVARSVRPELTSFGMNDMIQSVMELFQNQAKTQGIELSYGSETEVVIDGDRAALTQALVNIVKNAIEAVGNNGVIKIHPSEESEKVRISISDNGPGIEDIGSALRPFYTTKKDGTGLGLATASKIMADHLGELVIESKPGQGTRVDMVLPKKKGLA